MAKKKEQAEADIVVEPKYPKEQIIKSEKYSAFSDSLAAILKDGESYTFEEVEKKLEAFKKMVIKEEKNGGKK